MAGIGQETRAMIRSMAADNDDGIRSREQREALALEGLALGVHGLIACDCGSRSPSLFCRRQRPVCPSSLLCTYDDDDDNNNNN